jgi:hypothetical protein
MAKKRKKTPVVSCEDFLRGTCTRGSKCRYSHGDGEGSAADTSRETSVSSGSSRVARNDSSTSGEASMHSLENNARLSATCTAKRRRSIYPVEHPAAASLPKGRFLTPVRRFILHDKTSIFRLLFKQCSPPFLVK